MFGLFRMPRFIRRFIRRRTAHMSPDRALDLKSKISLLYAFVAWNMCGFIGYQIYAGRWTKIESEDDNLSQGRQFVKMLHLENVTLHRMKGLTYIDSCDLNEEMASKNDVINEDREQLEE